MAELQYRGAKPEEEAESASHTPRSPQGGLTRLFHYVTGTPRHRFKFAYLGGLVFLCWLTVFVMERGYPSFKISQCGWSGWEEWARGTSPYRVALVADPQLVDDHTYPSRPAGLMRVTEFVVDNYLRKNWVYIQKNLSPDTTVFLGDLFDGGRAWKDDKWYPEFDRWNRVFSLEPGQDVVWSLPGNHDIGYGNEIVPLALSRFEKHFGPLSREFDRGNHTFVQIDTISMENKNDSRIYEPPKEFVDAFRASQPRDKPAIVLTHVPFFRNEENSNCGRSREKGHKLDYVAGHQYQTQLDPVVTNDLLTAINPILVFSGDDHDACHVKHPFVFREQKNEAHEYTVKSISMAMGINKPGIQLLSLNPDTSISGKSYKTTICLMPNPFVPFIVYGLIGFASVAFLIVVHFFPAKLAGLTGKFRYFPLEDNYILPVSSRPTVSMSRFTKHVIKAFFKDVAIVAVSMIIFLWYFLTSIYWRT